jgi:hypothetical protein
MGNTHTIKTINYKDGQLIVLVVYMLPIFVVNCFGGVNFAHLCS